MIVTRFAPSPTGLLHLGHAFAALNAYDAAMRDGGRFHLRIEDIDTARSRLEFERAIAEDLRWLGLSWEEPVRRQSEHFDDYRAALERLGAAGFLYPCFCTRKDIADEIARAGEAPHFGDHGPEGPRYPGICRKLGDAERARRIDAGEPFAMRIDAAKAAAQTGALTFIERGHGADGQIGEQKVEPQLLGDVVLSRKETPASYHLAVVVDDALQGVTLVTRGADLVHATHIQRVLQSLLGLPEPTYAHHRLITDISGKKFSKRDNAVTLRAMRDGGETPASIRAMLGQSQR